MNRKHKNMNFNIRYLFKTFWFYIMVIAVVVTVLRLLSEPADQSNLQLTIFTALITMVIIPIICYFNKSRRSDLPEFIIPLLTGVWWMWQGMIAPAIQSAELASTAMSYSGLIMIVYSVEMHLRVIGRHYS